MEKTRVLVKNLLKDLGASPEIKGFRYLTDAILMVIEDENILYQGITKVVYPNIADKYKGATASQVERAMRHCIERVFERGDYDLIDEIFKHTTSFNKGKATNAQFIAMLADYLVCKYDLSGDDE